MQNTQMNIRRRKNNVSRKARKGGNDTKRLPDVIAPIHLCKCKYTSQVIGLTGSSNHATQLYYVNSIYHPEGTGSDTSNAIGYTELITLYENWQVILADITLTIICEEAFEILVAMAPSLVALTLSSAALTTQLGELPWGKTTILSRNTGMNRATLTSRINLSKLVGNRQFYHGTQAWYGGVGSRPVNLLLFYFAIASLSGDNLTNGVTFAFTIDYTVKFSGRIFNDILGFKIMPKSILKVRPKETEVSPEELEAAVESLTLT